MRFDDVILEHTSQMLERARNASFCTSVATLVVYSIYFSSALRFWTHDKDSIARDDRKGREKL